MVDVGRYTIHGSYGKVPMKMFKKRFGRTSPIASPHGEPPGMPHDEKFST